MIYTLSLSKLRNAILMAVLPLFVISCGSYQQASYYDNDGIYSDGSTRVVVERQPQRTDRYQEQENDTYSDYFGQKANQYDEILEGEIFTDVDSYNTNVVNDSINQDQLGDYYNNSNDYQGFGGWGDNTTSVSINIYDNGWNNWGAFGWANPYWGWNDPWFWGGGFGWGWNNPWRWNRWNNWGWGGRFGWGGGFGWGWNNWGWGGYGLGWNNWGYANNWGWNNRFNRNRYAFTNGRRGYYNRNNVNNSGIATALRGRSNVNTRGTNPRYRSTNSRSANTRRYSSTRSSRNYQGATRRTVGVDQNRAYRTSRSTRAVPRYNSSSRSSRTYRSGTSTNGYRSGISSRSRTATPRTSTYRNYGNSSRSNGYSSGRSSGYSSGRSSGSRGRGYSSGRSSSSRSSGSYRSSGSSSRSSGSYRSSGSSGGSRSSGRSSSGGRSGGGRRQ